MICRNCGKFVFDQDKFCPNCGTKMAAPETKNAPPPESRHEPAHRLFIKATIVVVLAFILLLLFIFIIDLGETSTNMKYGFYGNTKWGMTKEEVINKDKLSNFKPEIRDTTIRYTKIYSPGVSALITYTFTEENALECVEMEIQSVDGKHTNEDITTELITRYIDLFGQEYTFNNISYLWETENSKITITNRKDSIVEVDFLQIK